MRRHYTGADKDAQRIAVQVYWRKKDVSSQLSMERSFLGRTLRADG
jgi:hypothetical protein